MQACEPHGVPVTLKMRTGWCQAHKNAVSIALAAHFRKLWGCAMLTVHGRTREQGYKGQAEYDTMAAVKSRSAGAGGGQWRHYDAREAHAKCWPMYTGADAVMMGRAAQGRPWIFREIAHFLATGEHLAPPLVAEVRRAVCWRICRSTMRCTAQFTGVRSARKHIGWYVKQPTRRRGLPRPNELAARTVPPSIRRG